MIFIKPTVLRTSADGRELTSERYQYLMGEQERQTPPNRLFWGDPGQPALPPQGMCPARPAPTPTPPLARRHADAAPRAEPRPRRRAEGPERTAAAGWPRSRTDAATGFAHRIPYAFARAHGVLAQARSAAASSC